MIVARCLENGDKKVFKTLEEVAERLGVSIATVSRACVSMEECKGWLMRRADPVYAVRLKEGRSWRVAVEVRGGYMEYGNPGVRFRKREVDQVVDVTLAWYLQGDGDLL